MSSKTQITIMIFILIIISCLPITIRGEPRVNSRGDIELVVDKLKQDVTPNLHDPKAEVTYEITIFNRGSQTEQYLITETNDHGFFVIITPNSTNNLDSDQSALVTVIIPVDNNVPMTTVDYNTIVEVTAKSNSSNFSTVTLKTRILQAYGVEIQPLYTTTETGDSVENNIRAVTFPADIQNIGTGLDNFKLELSGDYSSWAKLNKSYFTLDSQNKASFKLDINIPRDTSVGDYDFELKAISRGDDDLYTTEDAYDQVRLTVEVTEFYDIRLDSEKTKKSALPDKVVGFNITVINLGNAFDDVELRMTDYDLEWNWWLSENSPRLSPMGDALGGDVRIIRLTGNVPTDMYGINGTYNISINVYSTATPSGKVLQNDGKPLVFTVVVGKVYGLDLILNHPTTTEEQKLDPGDSLNYNLTLVNLGNTIDELKLRALGEKSDWVTFPKDLFIVQPFETSQFNITVRIPNLNDSNLEEIEADRYLITIKATSENDPYAIAQVELTPLVNRFYKTELDSDLTLDATGAGLVTTDPNADPEYTRFTLTVTNKGNTMDKITIATNLFYDWLLEYEYQGSPSVVATVTLDPGRSENIGVDVYAPLDAENGDSQTLTINARSENGLVTSNFKIRVTVQTAVIVFKSLKVKDKSAGSTTIELTVINNGDTAAEDVEIKFYDQGILIHSEKIDRIEKNSEVVVSFNYDLEVGDHDIKASTQWSDSSIKKNTTFTTENEGIYSGLFIVLIIIIVVVVMLIAMLTAVFRYRAEQRIREKTEIHREKTPELVAIEKDVTKPYFKHPPRKLEPF